MSKIDKLLAEEGAAAEHCEMPEQLPEHVQMSRRNLGRSTVVSVRLSAEEHGKLPDAAEEANLPVSPLIRFWDPVLGSGSGIRLRDPAPGSGSGIRLRDPVLGSDSDPWAVHAEEEGNSGSVAERRARPEHEVFPRSA